MPAALSAEKTGGAKLALYFSVKEFLIMEFDITPPAYKSGRLPCFFSSASVISDSA